MKIFTLKSSPYHYEVNFGEEDLEVKVDKWGLKQEVWNYRCPRSELSPETTLTSSFGWRAWPVLKTSAIYLIVALLILGLTENWVRYLGYASLCLFLVCMVVFTLRLRKSEWVNILRRNGSRVCSVCFESKRMKEKEELLRLLREYVESGVGIGAEPVAGGNVAR